MTKQEAIEAKIKKASNTYADNYKSIPRDFKDAEIIYSSSFERGAKWYAENIESKTPIDFNKLRDEFFDECVDKRAFCEIGESFDRVVSLAPHDLFEWFKKKLTTKL